MKASRRRRPHDSSGVTRPSRIATASGSQCPGSGAEPAPFSAPSDHLDKSAECYAQHFRARRLMIYSFPTKAMFSTVLHDCRTGNEHALDDEYDQV